MKLKFIIQTTERKSRREEELQRSAALAHASEVSHRQSKWHRLKATFNDKLVNPQVKTSPGRQSQTSTASAELFPRTLPRKIPLINPISSSKTTELTFRPAIEHFAILVKDETDADEKPILFPRSNSPWHFTKGARVDPFNCVPWGADAPRDLDLCEPYQFDADVFDANGLLTVIQFCFPTFGSTFDAFGTRSLYYGSSYARWMLEEVASFQDLYHVMLACTKVVLAGENEREAALQHERHKARGISLLRHRLQLPTATADDGAILSIVHLSHYEAHNGNVRTAALHRVQVGKMIRARGGIRNLKGGSGMRALIELYHAWDFESTGTEWHSPPPYSISMPASMDQYDAISRLPLGFQDLALSGKIPAVTVDRILAMAGEEEPPDTGEKAPALAVTDSTFLQITEQFPGVTVCQDQDGPALERLLGLALVRYCKVQKVPFRIPLCLFHSVTLEMTEKVLLRKPSMDRAERSILLWIWLMTLDSWSPGATEPAWWLKEMIQRFPEIESWTVHDFTIFGQKFLWTDNLTQLLEENWILK